VPAELSSPTPSGLDPLCDADPLQEAETPHLLAYLAGVPDPRAPRGRRRGARRPPVGDRDRRMGRRYPQPVRAVLGARRDAPDHWAVPAETTIRRTLSRLDSQALATAIGAWLCDRDRLQRQRRRAIASMAIRCVAPNTTAARSTCWPRWTTPPAPCSPNARSTAPPARSPPSNHCLLRDLTAALEAIRRAYLTVGGLTSYLVSRT
jgi:hypothetical protein